MPTMTSSAPDQRARRRWNAARSAMYGVAPSRRASRPAAARSAGSKGTISRAPRWLSAGGRGRSAGSSRTPSVPRSVSFHHAAPVSITPARCSRCHTA
ncbi:MAG TPA: hypothetical protein VHG91_12565 [Longimicrobium sp.]|nr:hypothetical protein [Longimicrobium sp.]